MAWDMNSSKIINQPKKEAINGKREDCLEEDKRFRIQIAGERISVPPDAVINIEHERGDGEEEIEFQLKWKRE